MSGDEIDMRLFARKAGISINYPAGSVVFNKEVDAIIIGEDTATQIEALLQRDFAASAPVSLQAWERRPFEEHFEELKARLWEYWM